MSYEDVDEIKEMLHDAYMTVCCEVGENVSFKKTQSVAFTSGNRKISVIIEEVE
mgnify:CR=1 FL=1